MHSTRFDFLPDRRGPIPPRAFPPRAALREADWPRWLRSIERGRRSWAASPMAPTQLLADLTVCSFSLEGLFPFEGLSVERSAANPALNPTASPRQPGNPLRSRSQVRMRNHMAILYSIARCCGRGRALREPEVLRWYTSISSGLSTCVLSPANMSRIEQAVERINSPQMRPQAALTEIASLHAELLAEPVFPSFNGILARLLLTAHLARCGLPPVLFDPQRDANQTDPVLLLARLCELIQERFDGLANDSKTLGPA